MSDARYFLSWIVQHLEGIFFFVESLPDLFNQMVAKVELNDSIPPNS
jgi:hypothetical protein